MKKARSERLMFDKFFHHMYLSSASKSVQEGGLKSNLKSIKRETAYDALTC